MRDSAPILVRHAITCPTWLLGINNRDLHTFRPDLGATLRLAELVEDRSVLVSESGINEAADTRKLTSGVGAVLVGESLMRNPDIAAKIADLFTAGS